MEPGHEDREYAHRHAVLPGRLLASMEPGHEDREYSLGVSVTVTPDTPQWSPVMKTGNTLTRGNRNLGKISPQWSPVMKTGNTQFPGLRICCSIKPQWSPVMKTGNTRGRLGRAARQDQASMEPGHEDREYHPVRVPGEHQHDASMEPGHEDREYSAGGTTQDDIELPQWSPVMKTGNTCAPGWMVRRSVSCLNGARS